LYGTLQAALIFWRILSDTLKERGFKLNKYDQCVTNKMINGQQCTIIWHSDDIKLSHLKKTVMEDIIAQLNKSSKESLLTTTCDKVTTKGKGKISMYK